MDFHYLNNNKIQKVNISIGKDWNSYKNKDDKSSLNSVFDFVDKNSDGKVDKEELNILQKLLKIADSQIEKFKNNNIIENEELNLLVNKIENFELGTLEGNKKPEIKIIDLQSKDKLTNYTYLGTFFGEEDNKIVNEVSVDYSGYKNLDKGKYYIESYKESFIEGNIILTPVIRAVHDKSNQDGTTNWNEGINRNISQIQLKKANYNSELIEFMNKVGEEQGFSIELLDAPDAWIEDFGVVRADKKQVIPNYDSSSRLAMYDNDNKIIAKRRKITQSSQGNAMQYAETYSRIISQDDVIQGKTYLEGGNVLNTLTSNGEPAAIIGEESIKYTICALHGVSDISPEITEQAIKNCSEQDINMAKKQIAEELGIKEENVTYIPQFDFHIDMHYRPLNDGQIAVPDYGAGINVLNGLIEDIDNKITSTDISPEQKNKLQKQKEDYLKLIDRLEEMNNKTEEIAQEAEKELKDKGYEIVRIPSFTEIDKGSQIPTEENSVENPINFMNGVCGTSAKTGDKYFITNTSGDETLDAYMEKYFKETAGFDKVYFAPTKKYLANLGGIDCLTKEF